VPPLGILFVFLGACFLGLALSAVRAGNTTGWVVFVAALAVAVWFGDAAFRILRRRR
jgi:hypothetical protein